MSEEPEDIRTRQVQHIQSLYAFDLFAKHRFDDSLQLFLKLNTGRAVFYSLRCVFFM